MFDGVEKTVLIFKFTSFIEICGMFAFRAPFRGNLIKFANMK